MPKFTPGKRTSVFQPKVVKMSRKESSVPQFGRRVMIPPEPSTGSNLWAVLKSFVGKDLSRISLPVINLLIVYVSDWRELLVASCGGRSAPWSVM